MKPETRAHIDRAFVLLRRARTSLTAMSQEPLMAEDAARNSYYAAFHAAKALIFEQSNTVHKKHGSVHRAFAELVRNQPAVDAANRDFLPKAYDYKRIGDYDTGAGATISIADAKTAVAQAEIFVEVVIKLLPPLTK